MEAKNEEDIAEVFPGVEEADKVQRLKMSGRSLPPLQ